MRALNPMAHRRRAIDDLRLAIQCLPRTTRVAMLEGVAANDIIVGAYSNGDGICPMLAAHRAGGRTNFIGFAEAWDRFAQRSTTTRRARRATERELLILRTHLEASLLEEEAGADTLAGAIAEHRELAELSAAERRAAEREAAERAAEERRAAQRVRHLAARRRTRGAQRPGDPDRSGELGRRGGWAWTRIFRRYDDYERALERLAREAEATRGGRGTREAEVTRGDRGMGQAEVTRGDRGMGQATAAPGAERAPERAHSAV